MSAPAPARTALSEGALQLALEAAYDRLTGYAPHLLCRLHSPGVAQTLDRLVAVHVARSLGLGPCRELVRRAFLAQGSARAVLAALLD